MDKVELPLLKGEDKERYIPGALIIGFAALFIIFVITCLSLTIKKQVNLHYSESSFLNYNVYLKPNDFYSEKFLPKGNTYIASLIDYVDTNFSYSFNVKDSIAIEYSYYVDATVEVNNSSGKNIFTKQDTILNRKDFQKVLGKGFKIDENIKIDYDKYNKIAQSFIDNYGLSADAVLNVTLYTNIIGSHDSYDKKINDTGVIKLSIPLTSKTIEIEPDYDLSNSYDAVLQYRDILIKNPVLFYFSIILAVVDLAGMIGIIVWVIKSRDSLTLYKKKLARILRDYDRYISETAITQRVEDMMKTKSLRIELVKSFEGLIDIRDNLGVPILYHEERPGLEAVFYIVTERVGYIYIMKASDFDKIKKADK